MSLVKRKKAWFVKNLISKNHFLKMMFKTSFSKYTFNKKHGLKMGYQTHPTYIYFLIEIGIRIKWSLSLILGGIRIKWHWTKPVSHDNILAHYY